MPNHREEDRADIALLGSMAAPGSEHPLESHGNIVGMEVVLLTTSGEHLSCVVFAFDKLTDLLVLKEAGSHAGVTTLRLLRASFVKEVLSCQHPKVRTPTLLTQDLSKHGAPCHPIAASCRCTEIL